ncbi:low-density lipoprotein receptor-related protein 12 [Elysia marginata]|uniref:Low-density lipoprotein receptor-related protein 12 n=1 Tax=Elysia marginata TaxID=1093978 RepID=A0AAV4J014_9GAST|nr:low-density lipoprotein receptor-related protein 12 [Elysia marginata]
MPRSRYEKFSITKSIPSDRMDTVGFYSLLFLACTLMVSSEAETTECQYHALQHSHTLIQSPNYPLQYPPNTCVLWFYSGVAGSDFFLRILDLDMPGEMGLCSLNSDFLVIGPGSQNLLCGQLTKGYQPEYHVRLTPHNDTVYIMFNSSSNSQKRTGFRAEYYIKSPVTHLSQFPVGSSDNNVDQTTERPWSGTKHVNGHCHHIWTSSFSGRIPQKSFNPKTVHECNGFMTWLVVAPKPKTQFTHASFKYLVDITQCMEGFISCGNENSCYDPSARCNGSWECPLQGRDELNCGSTQCPIGKYSCDNMNTQQCYEEKDRCNGKGTCTNYKDEMNCDPSKCNQEKGLFLCSNSRCIYEKWRCDGTSDCADSSDENGCGLLLTPRVIVAAVVGSLVCSLLMVVALGCVCKVYRLRQIQLLGAGTGGSCCSHGRHDSPLTRQLAEMFRQRAPPPPYHEAMLTSRPYHEMLRESGNEGQGGTQNEDSRGGSTERGGRPARDRARMFRPPRRRESDAGSSGTVQASQRQSCRHPRVRRQHREVNQQDLSLFTAADRNTGFIEVGSLTLLCSGLGQEESSERHPNANIDPPPYSVTDPSNEESLETREEAGDFSSEDNSEEVSDDADAEVEGMPLRQQRKARRSRSNQVEERRAIDPCSGVPCLEMFQVTRRRDHTLQTNTGQSVHPHLQAAHQRERNQENESSCKIEDETQQASFSLSSTAGLESPLSFERENIGDENIVRLEEESDSDCILLGDEDDKDREEEEEEDDIDDEDPIYKEDSDDSDTACLLSAV